MLNDKKVALNGKITKYLRWPINLSVLWIVVTAIIFFIDKRAGVVMAFETILFIVIAIVMMLRFYPNIKRYLVDFGAEYSQIQRQMMHEFEIPYALLDCNGKMLWHNSEMEKACETKLLNMRGIESIFKEFTKDKFEFKEEKKEFKVEYNEKIYRAVLKKFKMKDAVDEVPIAVLDSDDDDADMFALYLFDDTRIQQLSKENKNDKMIPGLIYIDNYEEVLQSIEDARRTLLVALIDRQIQRYFAEMDGLVRKLEKDKYFVVVKAKNIAIMQSKKFSLLDDVKNVKIGNERTATISIGFGMGSDSYVQNYTSATAAIDMALGRGGDQAVLKDGAKIYYYGGKSKSVEKNTRVKARVKAHALRELIETRDKVFIMGHHLGDNDSYGAAIGLYRAITTMGKKAYVVTGTMSSSVKPLIDKFTTDNGYEEDMFITGTLATTILEKNDMLIVVDCNRAGYTEYPELVRRAQTLVVIDHHRQSADAIENAHLSYIEPYSSSACEMVTEIMQYMVDSVKMKPYEADALYSGIMMDTNNFSNRTGVRTFEAAAYLRKNGADIVRVRKMFRDDIGDYKAKAKAIQNTEIFMDKYAIAICPSEGTSMPTVVGAQAANELLNIKGIKAAFVCTFYNEKVYLSARSIDEVNVQLIAERLGGGGHMNLAGAQIEDCTCEQAKTLIKEIIQDMTDEGEI